MRRSCSDSGFAWECVETVVVDIEMVVVVAVEVVVHLDWTSSVVVAAAFFVTVFFLLGSGFSFLVEVLGKESLERRRIEFQDS
jgi:hypothetical protein